MTSEMGKWQGAIKDQGGSVDKNYHHVLAMPSNFKRIILSVKFNEVLNIHQQNIFHSPIFFNYTNFCMQDVQVMDMPYHPN